MSIGTNFNTIHLLIGMLLMGVVTITNPPEIARTWWSNLKSWLVTSLGNLATAVNSAATLVNGKVPAEQLPVLALTNIIVSAENTLADYIAEEWSADGIRIGDVVQITTTDDSIELWMLYQNDGSAAGDYKKIAFNEIDWDNVLNIPANIAALEALESVDNLTNLAAVKIYRALLTQSSTDAPVATVLENSLGGALVLTYSAVGTYIGTLAGAFAGTLKPIKETRDDVLLKITKVDEDSIKIETTDLSGTPGLADGLLTGDFIELIVYPAPE